MKRSPGNLEKFDAACAERAFSALRAVGGSYESTFAELVDDPPLEFKKWTDQELAELIARNPETAPARLAASEVRSREAWQTPARWSLLVSILAVLMSAVALIRTF